MSSTQQQQVIVKAYYNDLVETQPEIRRFALDVSANNDAYQALETTIPQLNSAYPRGQFTLQYVDEDNERITFSSNNELRSALVNIPSGGIIKIYIKPKARKPEETNQNSTIHEGVTCDGCQGPVIGNRYKCVECPNYDLCQTCSDKKVHPEHNMIKLTRSFGRHRRCGRGGPFGGRCGGGRRFWRHFMHQQEGGAGAFQMPADMESFLSQYKGKELAELIEAYLPEYLRTEKINKMLTQFKTGEQADKPVDQSAILENVGKFLREILSPFGIDCDYFVDNQQAKKPTEQAETKEQSEEATASNNTSTEPEPKTETASTPPASVPAFGSLLDQLQTMFTPTTTVTVNEQQAQEQKKVDECIERMTAMGFIDSNGVLTELIKSKKGDLNQVLDTLNPRNYKN